MPYKRYAKTFRKVYKRFNPGMYTWLKNYKSNQSNSLSIAQKALSLAVQTRGMLNVEKKFINGQFSYTSEYDGPAITELSGNSQGTDYNQREGLQYRTKKLTFRYNVLPNFQTGEPFGRSMRIILFIWNDDNNPTLSDVLDFGRIGTNSSSIYANYQLNNIPKVLRILYDKTHLLMPDPANIKHQVPLITKNIKLGHKVRFKDGNNNTSSEGRVFVLMVSDSSVADNNIPTGQFEYKLTYVDN